MTNCVDHIHDNDKQVPVMRDIATGLCCPNKLGKRRDSVGVSVCLSVAASTSVSAPEDEDALNASWVALTQIALQV